MTLKEIEEQFVKDGTVPGFSRAVEQFQRKDGRQVLQLCRSTSQFRVSMVAIEDHVASCSESVWQALAH